MQIFSSLRDRLLLDFDTIAAKHVKMVVEDQDSYK